MSKAGETSLFDFKTSSLQLRSQVFLEDGGQYDRWLQTTPHSGQGCQKLYGIQFPVLLPFFVALKELEIVIF
jgi:hypothetical protein